MEGAQKDEWVMNLLKLDVNATSWVIHNCEKLPWWFTLHDGVSFFCLELFVLGSLWAGGRAGSSLLTVVSMVSVVSAAGLKVWVHEGNLNSAGTDSQGGRVLPLHHCFVSIILTILSKYISDKTEQSHDATWSYMKLHDAMWSYMMCCMLIGWERILSSPKTSVERDSCYISAVVLAIDCFSSEYFFFNVFRLERCC